MFDETVTLAQLQQHYAGDVLDVSAVLDAAGIRLVSGNPMDVATYTYDTETAVGVLEAFLAERAAEYSEEHDAMLSDYLANVKAAILNGDEPPAFPTMQIVDAISTPSTATATETTTTAAVAKTGTRPEGEYVARFGGGEFTITEGTDDGESSILNKIRTWLSK